MAFKMKYKNLEEVVKQLRGAVKAHGKQADIVEGHIKDMNKGESHTKFNAGLRAAEKAGKLPEEFAKEVRKSSGFSKRKFAPDQLKAIWASKHERGEA